MSSSNDNKEVKMVNATKQSEMVKVKLNSPIRINRGGSDTIISPDQNPDPKLRKEVTVDLTEEEAVEFCDKKFDLGYKDKFGSSEARDARKHTVYRAERVK